MKSNVYSLNCEKKETIELPRHFREKVREDLIRKAVLALQTHDIQPHGTKEGAGMRYSDYVSKRRRKFRGTYGKGQSRTPRKVMAKMGERFTMTGASVPQTVGGRRAHPPRVEKTMYEKINNKERRKAIRSAISATGVKDIVESRGHKVSKIEDIPIIFEKEIEKIQKAKDIKSLLEKFGLGPELKRVESKKIRAGRGKTRGRKYKKKVGPLFVVSEKCDLMKSAKNIPGSDVMLVKDLNAEVLAPGTHPGRLVVWSSPSIKKLENLFK